MRGSSRGMGRIGTSSRLLVAAGLLYLLTKEATCPHRSIVTSFNAFGREEDAQLVEVLPADEFEDEHLPGAVNLPLKELDRHSAASLDPSRPVIVYCYDYQ